MDRYPSCRIGPWLRALNQPNNALTYVPSRSCKRKRPRALFIVLYCQGESMPESRRSTVQWIRLLPSLPICTWSIGVCQICRLRLPHASYTAKDLWISCRFPLEGCDFKVAKNMNQQETSRKEVQTRSQTQVQNSSALQALCRTWGFEIKALRIQP